MSDRLGDNRVSTTHWVALSLWGCDMKTNGPTWYLCSLEVKVMAWQRGWRHSEAVMDDLCDQTGSTQDQPPQDHHPVHIQPAVLSPNNHLLTWPSTPPEDNTCWSHYWYSLHTEIWHYSVKKQFITALTSNGHDRKLPCYLHCVICVLETYRFWPHRAPCPKSIMFVWKQNCISKTKMHCFIYQHRNYTANTMPYLTYVSHR